MSLDIQQEIGGVMYTASKIPPKPLWLIRMRLLALFGPAILEKADKITSKLGGDKDSPVPVSDVLEIMADVIRSCEPETTMNLLEDICGHCSKGPNKISDLSFDAAFQDAPETAPWQVAFMFLKVNFKDFLPESIQMKLSDAASKVAEKGLDALVKSKSGE